MRPVALVHQDGSSGKHGKLLANADLDACHGHTHRVKLDGKTVRIYHYHATLEYPYTVAAMRGRRSPAAHPAPSVAR